MSIQGSMTSNICVIPARGGSKRLPRKNIKSFHGKPLIAWSIQAAISSRLFDEVFVSTDDVEIASVAKAYGAKVPFLRPRHLASDHSTDKDVLDSLINWFDTFTPKPDVLCYLYATAPFVSASTLGGCYNLLINSNASRVQTITTYPYPVQRSLQQNSEGFLSFQWPQYSSTRSQDLPELYHDAGQCYFLDVQRYWEKPSILGYLLPRLACQDIDTAEDFEFAEILFSRIQQSRNHG